MGRSKAKGGRKPKPKSPVYLGLPDEACDAGQANDVFSTAVGGIPGWLSPSQQPPVEATVCDHCQGPMLLLFQAYAPLETSSYERALYVWGCNTRQCMGHPGSFKVLRGHQYNHAYAMKLKPSKAPTTGTTAQQVPFTPELPAASKSLALPTQSASPLEGATGFQLGDLWGGGFHSVTGSTPAKPSTPSGGLSATPKSPVLSNAKTSVGTESQGTTCSKVTVQLDELHLSISPANDDLSDSDYETMADAFISGGQRAAPAHHTKPQLHHQADSLPTLLSSYLETALTKSNSDPEAVDSGTRWTPKLHLPGYYLYTTEEALEDTVSGYKVDDGYSSCSMTESSSSGSSRSSRAMPFSLPSSPSANTKASQKSSAGANNSQSPTPAGGTTGKDGAWKDETYEQDSLPSGMDRGLQRFLERVAEWPDQCVRYNLGGIPLLYSFKDSVARSLYSIPTTTTSVLSSPTPTSSLHPTGPATPSASMTRALPRYSTHRIPKCQYCGEPRIFECQLMPNLLLLLQTERHAAIALQSFVTITTMSNSKSRQVRAKGLPSALATKGMEWGTVLIFSCRADCHPVQAKDAFFQECALVQLEQE
ncbi:hypothetical protein H4R35_000488 [Dimargaris xerosporica]|nr:hypothetical protein H4R35_000488 [Dimargaris xerosporica]